MKSESIVFVIAALFILQFLQWSIGPFDSGYCILYFMMLKELRS